MTLQVLIATMHQTDYSLLEKMNIQSDRKKRKYQEDDFVYGNIASEVWRHEPCKSLQPNRKSGLSVGDLWYW